MACNISYEISTVQYWTTTDHEIKEVPKPLLPTEIKELIDIVVVRVLCPLIEVAGIVTNILNLYIFAKLGLTDSVSMAFFALSFSDLVLLVAALFNWTCSTVAVFTFTWTVHPFHLSYLVIWFYQMILDVSILTVTYISIQRCACVALPFKFRSAFTTWRTAVILMTIYSFGIACYTPMFANQGLAPFTDSLTNVTYLALHFADQRDQVLAVIDVMNRIALPTVAQTIVLICLVILVNSLKASRNFRESSAATTIFKNSKKSKKTGDKPDRNKNGKRGHENEAGNLKSREIQVIKVVTFVSFQFVVCNTPSVAIAFCRRFMPDFNLYKPQHNLYMTMNVLKNVFEFIGATVNFLIYLKFNSKFRDFFLARFSKFAPKMTAPAFRVH